MSPDERMAVAEGAENQILSAPLSSGTPRPLTAWGTSAEASEPHGTWHGWVPVASVPPLPQHQ